MTQDHDTPRGDPWNAFGYIVAGVLSYGLIGYGLDRWWGTDFLVPIGIMTGAVLGLYMTWARFKAPTEPDPVPQNPTSSDLPSLPSHPTEPQR